MFAAPPVSRERQLHRTIAKTSPSSLAANVTGVKSWISIVFPMSSKKADTAALPLRTPYEFRSLLRAVEPLVEVYSIPTGVGDRGVPGHMDGVFRGSDLCSVVPLCSHPYVIDIVHLEPELRSCRPAVGREDGEEEETFWVPRPAGGVVMQWSTFVVAGLKVEAENVAVERDCVVDVVDPNDDLHQLEFLAGHVHSLLADELVHQLDPALIGGHTVLERSPVRAQDVESYDWIRRHGGWQFL